MVLNGLVPTKVPGRGTEISEGGMVLYAGVNLKAGDLMQIEFIVPHQSRVTAMVRNRTGYCYGLEFLTPLPSSSELSRTPELESMSASELDQLISRHRQQAAHGRC
jgi:hypothetical protein